ncbi:MAG: aquaporin family protein [Chloroflexi bacterium]|nr:aquaporin family protein [Chloroflexota bacterium]
MRLLQQCIAEAAGTYLLVLFGTGAVASSVLTGALVGLWQVAVVWGLGVTFAIYAAAPISGAHLNPAISLAMALFRPGEFPLQRLLSYWAAQVAGAVLAGISVLLVFGPFLARFEAEHGLVRGQPGSQLSAMVFGEYFPNPALFGTGEAAQAMVSPLGAAAVEGLGTAVLAFMVFALTDRRNPSLPAKHLAAPLIGFTVAALISLFAPITQAGWNPARDFGPRLVAYFAGWGAIAIPGPSSGFWAYIAGPLVGGLIGAAAYHLLIRRALPQEETPPTPSEKGDTGGQV